MTACAQRSLGRPMQSAIETSPTGSVRQSAFRADPVRRTFRAEDGSTVELTVPGSYYEFISRDTIVGSDGKKRLDLRFNGDGARDTIRKKTAAG